MKHCERVYQQFKTSLKLKMELDCASCISVKVGTITFYAIIRLVSGGRGGTIRTSLTSWFKCIHQIGSRWNPMRAITLGMKIFDKNRFLAGL